MDDTRGKEKINEEEEDKKKEKYPKLVHVTRLRVEIILKFKTLDSVLVTLKYRVLSQNSGKIVMFPIFRLEKETSQEEVEFILPNVTNVNFRLSYPIERPLSIQKHGFEDTGGPPDYDSLEWQHYAIEHDLYYKIIHESRIIGGIILSKQGKAHIELLRIYLLPAFQNQGFGTKIFKFLETKLPTVKKWTLNTPAWAHRNRHFYEKLGYVKIHEETLDDGGVLVFYEKTI